MKKIAILSTLFLTTLAIADVKPTEIIEKLKPSLVVVQYTYDGEAGRRDLSGMGVVVREDGLVVTSIDLTPRAMPDEQMKDFKIIIPGDDEVEYDADFLGRDERYNLSFVKLKKKEIKLPPIQFVDSDVQVGDRVMSIGLLPKSSGYNTAYDSAEVSAKMRGPVPQVMVTGGLGSVGSVVLNSTGQAIGLVHMQTQRMVFLNDPNAMTAVEIPSRYYVPAKDFLKGIATPPELGQPIKLPFMGVNQLTGLSKDVAEFYGLKGQVAVQVGDVVAGMPADKAGLKKGHIIVKVDGKPLERGDEPEEAPMIFTRRIGQTKNVGDTVVLTVLADKGKTTKEITVTLEERPMVASKAKRFYAEDLGFTSRELVYDDIYNRRLNKDSKGLIVGFVRPQSASQAAQLQINDMITQLNQTPVTDVEQFKTDYKKFREEKPKEAVVLEVLRQGNTQIIRIEPPRE